MAKFCRSMAAAWFAEFSDFQNKDLSMSDLTTPLFNLTGRVALITGAGQGMGLGAARALCRQGASVVINDFYAERAESAAAALKAEGFNACAAPGDITLPEVRAQIAATACSSFGEIDILVNNAGVPPGMPLRCAPSKTWATRTLNANWT